MKVAAMTVQGRFVRAPQTTSTSAIGSRGHRGIGNGQPGVSENPERNPIHANQSLGLATKEMATMTAAGTTAIAKLRHSLRTRNHRSPRPMDGLVSRGSVQNAGQRRPST